MTPAWLLDIFAAVMLGVAAVSAARLVAARPGGGGRGTALADIDVAHLLMAIAMAGMLASSLRTLPDGVWEVIFGVLTAWFGYRVVRDSRVSGTRALAGGHCAPHLIHAASMLYMFCAVTPPSAHAPDGTSGMAGRGSGSMATLAFPLLAFVFTLLLAGYTVWDLDQLSGPGVRAHYSLAAVPLAPVPVLAGVGSGGLAPTPAPAPAPRPAEPNPEPTGSGPADGQGRGVLAPWVAVSCRIAMGVTMAFMLVTMI